MQSKLNNSQIEYIFFHLNHHFDFSNEIRNRIAIEEKTSDLNTQIVFPLSDKEIGEIKYIDHKPILFPLSSTKEFYFYDNNNNLIFSDDILKSAFYLLSGYQETQKYNADQYERFTYKASIQKKLSIPTFPLVDFYFKIISKGIEEFCKINGIAFNKRKIWGSNNFGFLLTHDVDRIDKYTFKLIKYRIKQLLGLSPSKGNKKDDFDRLAKSITGYLTKENPYWNFKWMKSYEEKFGFNSVWFFLPQGDKNIDAHFSFKEERIKKLVQYLNDCKDEIELHGTYHSLDSITVLKKDFNSLKGLIKVNPKGNRQHWLRFKYPETLRNLEEIGMQYDSSWAFNDHIGWRNSYCLPFKPYDIEQDRMMDIWEFPLTVMDVTLFEYQNFDKESALKHIDEILNITEEFGGLFTLLWHNSQFQLESGEDLKDFYIKVLEKINMKNPKSILPKKFLENI